MKQYSEEYDAFYDDETNEWLEPKCSQPEECDFCSKRPERPIEDGRVQSIQVLPGD
jgi:hypothetical protein